MGTETGPDSSRSDGSDAAGYGPYNPPPESHGDHDEHEHVSRWPPIAALGAGGL